MRPVGHEKQQRRQEESGWVGSFHDEIISIIAPRVNKATATLISASSAINLPASYHFDRHADLPHSNG
jgi:hypothetical protein